MNQASNGIEGLLRARAKDTEARRERVAAAVTELQRAGATLTISAVARAAGVHRSFLHRHPDLAEAIHAAETQSPAEATNRTSEVSLRTELANVHAAHRRLAAHTRLLEVRLSELLGDEAARAGGLLQPAETADTFQLTQTIQNLERTVDDLRIELADRSDDLNAARAANRALMAANNQRS
jgi:hypothetical protein